MSTLTIGYDDGHEVLGPAQPDSAGWTSVGELVLLYPDVPIERKGRIDRLRVQAGGYDSGWVAVASQWVWPGCTYTASFYFDLRDKTPRPAPIRRKSWWRRLRG